MAGTMQVLEAHFWIETIRACMYLTSLDGAFYVLLLENT